MTHRVRVGALVFEDIVVVDTAREAFLRVIVPLCSSVIILFGLSTTWQPEGDEERTSTAGPVADWSIAKPSLTAAEASHVGSARVDPAPEKRRAYLVDVGSAFWRFAIGL